jgi:DNA-binding NarL/FixJ family response regulator
LGEGSTQTTLVGRAEELGRVELSLDQVERGASRVLAVSGEAGIGKTRILAEIGARAERRGHSVLRGNGTEFEGEVSFGAVVEALDDVLTSLGPRELDDLRQRLPQLADVFPAIGRQPESSVVPATERYRHYQAIRTLLQSMAEARPLTILVDDLHWADLATIEVIAHLVRHPPAARVLLVLSFRTGQASPILLGPLTRAVRDEHAEQLDLATLSEEAAVVLLAAEHDAGRRREIFVEGGGNPFYMQELLRAPSSSGAIEPRGPAQDGGAQIPARVMAALEEDLRHLSPENRRMLEGAAVVGEPFEPELAAEAVGLPVNDALDLLDELVALDWVRPGATPRLFRFRHPIVRRAVYDSIAPGRRIAAHRNAADALTRLGASAAVRAHHTALSARLGDETAIATLIDAALSVSATAPGSAAQWLNAALTLVPADDVGRRFSLLGPLAQAQAASGAMEDACETLAEITTTLPPEAGAFWTQAVATLASLELYLGRHRGAGRRLEAALQLLSADSEHAVPLLVVLTVDAAYRGDRDRAVQWAAQAVERSATAADPARRVSALAAQALSLEMAGQIEVAEHWCTEAAAEVDSLTDNQLAPTLETLYHLGAAEMFLERFDIGVRHLERGVAIALRYGNIQCVMPTRTFLAYGLWRLGRLDDAQAVAAEAVETGRLLRLPAATAWALAIAASIWSASDAAQALRLSEEATALLADVDDDVTKFGSHALIAAACASAGEPERCITEANLAGAPHFAHLEATADCHLSEAVVASMLALDRLGEAQAWVERGDAFAAGLGLPVAAGATERARALVLLAMDEPASAAKLALAAADAAAERLAPVESARSRVVAGRALAVSGDRGGAVRELRRARQELARCGARRYEREAARELRSLGVAAPTPVARRAGDVGTNALSKREREIAVLVATGKSNADIAAVLFLSQKTVEGHMGRIFKKLDVSSRAQVAATIAREEVATAGPDIPQ